MRKSLMALALIALCGALPALAEEKAERKSAAEDKRPEVKATCTASCGGTSTVTCTTSGSCESKDRNCLAGQRGYVQCGGIRKNCPLACPVIQDCSANLICNMACGVSDPDCIQENPCVDRPAQGCYYTWSPQTYCCLTTNPNCQDYCY